jgi:predicted RNA polymerase sigma factor
MPQNFTEEEIQAQLKRIQRIVNIIVPMSAIDKEQLALDIWTELWMKDLPVTWVPVHARCVDAIRRQTRIQRRVRSLEVINEEEVQVTVIRPSSLSTSDPSTLEQVNKLMMNSNLSPEDRLLVYYKFYRDLSSREIQEITSIPKTIINERLRKIISQIKVHHPTPEGAR